LSKLKYNYSKVKNFQWTPLPLKKGSVTDVLNVPTDQIPENDEIKSAQKTATTLKTFEQIISGESPLLPQTFAGGRRDATYVKGAGISPQPQREIYRNPVSQVILEPFNKINQAIEEAPDKLGEAIMDVTSGIIKGAMLPVTAPLTAVSELLKQTGSVGSVVAEAGNRIMQIPFDMANTVSDVAEKGLELIGTSGREIDKSLGISEGVSQKGSDLTKEIAGLITLAYGVKLGKAIINKYQGNIPQSTVNEALNRIEKNPELKKKFEETQKPVDVLGEATPEKLTEAKLTKVETGKGARFKDAETNKFISKAEAETKLKDVQQKIELPEDAMRTEEILAETKLTKATPEIIQEASKEIGERAITVAQKSIKIDDKVYDAPTTFGHKASWDKAKADIGEVELQKAFDEGRISIMTESGEWQKLGEQKSIETKPTLKSWLESQPDVELVKKENLGITGQGEQIGAYTQKLGDKFTVSYADYTPETSFAKEIGRVLSNKITADEMAKFSTEISNLGIKNDSMPNKFANAIKEVLINPESRTKAPELVKYLESQEVPVSEVSRKVGEIPEVPTTQKQRAKISSEFKSPITGESHYNSLKKFTTDTQLNEYMSELGKIEKSRGVLTKDIVDDLSAKLGLTQKDIIKLKAGETRNVEQVRGMRQIVADNLLEMQKFLDEKTGNINDIEAKQLKGLYSTHLAMKAKVMGLVTESARVLQEMNRPVTAREFDVLTQINKKLKKYGEDVPLPDKIKKLEKEDIYWKYVTEIANIPRLAMTGFDMSAPLRQGYILSLRRPYLVSEAAKTMVKAFFKEEVIKGLDKDIQSRPNVSLYEKAKLHLADMETGDILKGSRQEESYIGNNLVRKGLDKLKKYPIIGELAKFLDLGISGAERAFNSYLNKMRVDSFDAIIDGYKKAGTEITDKLIQDTGKLINLVTYRGNLGKYGERIAPLLNAVLFAPKNLAAKFQLLNPAIYAKMEKPARIELLRSVGTMVGVNMAILSLAKLSGANIELDPRSPDFLKMRWGKTRLDPWGGFQQIIRFLSQMTTGEVKSSDSGLIRELDPKQFPYITRADLIGSFIRSKTSPSAGLIWDAFAEETMIGEDVFLDKELIEKTIPLYIQDIADLVKTDGIENIGFALPAFFGWGLQAYKPRTGIGEFIGGLPENQRQQLQNILNKESEVKALKEKVLKMKDPNVTKEYFLKLTEYNKLKQSDVYLKYKFYNSKKRSEKRQESNKILRGIK